MTPNAWFSHAASVTSYPIIVIINSPLVAGSAMLKLVGLRGIDPRTFDVFQSTLYIASLPKEFQC